VYKRQGKDDIRPSADSIWVAKTGINDYNDFLRVSF